MSLCNTWLNACLPLFSYLLSATQNVIPTSDLLTMVFFPNVTLEECLALRRSSWGENTYTHTKKTQFVERMNKLNSITYSLCPCIVYLICLGFTFFICTIRILVIYLSINASTTSNTVAAQGRLSRNYSSHNSYYGLGSL